MEVVVHKGIIREKPTSEEEARQFLKGFKSLSWAFMYMFCWLRYKFSVENDPGILLSGYSGGHVSTVGSVLVTNLKTGKRSGGVDKAEVLFTSFGLKEFFLICLMHMGIFFFFFPFIDHISCNNTSAYIVPAIQDRWQDSFG